MLLVYAFTIAVKHMMLITRILTRLVPRGCETIKNEIGQLSKTVKSLFFTYVFMIALFTTSPAPARAVQPRSRLSTHAVLVFWERDCLVAKCEPIRRQNSNPQSDSLI